DTWAPSATIRRLAPVVGCLIDETAPGCTIVVAWTEQMMVTFFTFLAMLSGTAQSPGPGAVVVGRVVEAGSGRAIAGAILTRNGAAVIRRSGRPAPRVMTDANGAFTIRGLAAGTLYLNVTKGGYVDATLGQRRPGGSTQPLQLHDGQRATDI